MVKLRGASLRRWSKARASHHTNCGTGECSAFRWSSLLVRLSSPQRGVPTRTCSKSRRRRVRVDWPVLTYRLSMATAFTGLILFALSLAVGPLGLLATGRMLPVSNDLRRDVGILAGVFSVAHVAFGLFVYTDVRLYFLYPVA